MAMPLPFSNEETNIQLTRDTFLSNINHTLTAQNGAIIFGNSLIQYSHSKAYKEYELNKNAVLLDLFDGIISSSILQCALNINSKKAFIQDTVLNSVGVIGENNPSIILKNCIYNDRIPSEAETENVTRFNSPFSDFKIDSLGYDDCHKIKRPVSNISFYYGDHIDLETPKIYVVESVFYDINNHQSFGGAICLKSPAHNLVASVQLEYSSFLRCNSLNEGGALYFKTCDVITLNRIFGEDCSARCGTFMSCVLHSNCDNCVINLTHIGRCSREYNKDNGIVFNFEDSYSNLIVFKSLNISHNKGMTRNVINMKNAITINFFNIISNNEWKAIFGRWIKEVNCTFGNFINNSLSLNSSTIFNLLGSSSDYGTISSCLFLGNVIGCIKDSRNIIVENSFSDYNYSDFYFNNNNTLVNASFPSYRVPSFDILVYIEPNSFLPIYILIISLASLGLITLGVVIFLYFVLKKNSKLKNRLLIDKNVIDDFG